MNLNEMLKSMNEADKPGSEPGSSLGKQSSKKTVGYNRMMNILLGNEKFEGEINTPEEFRAVIDAILNDKFKTKASLKKKAKEVDKIIKKIESGKTITKNEEEMADDFADDVEDELFQMTYMKKYTAQSEGGSGGQANKARFSHSIPVKYTTDGGKVYYGLITPPTGFIAWQNKEVGKIAKNDPELTIPPRLNLLDTTWTVDKVVHKDLMNSDRFVVKDSSAAKREVTQAFENHGATITPKGDVPGIEKVMKKVEFWKDIAKIF